jgi:hypothetical protein
MKTRSQYIRFLGQDSKLEPPEYKSHVLTLELIFSVRRENTPAQSPGSFHFS